MSSIWKITIKIWKILGGAKDYDAEVHEYYDLRDLNNRVDEFTTQIAKTMDKSVANRANTLKDLQKQGFFID